MTEKYDGETCGLCLRWDRKNSGWCEEAGDRSPSADICMDFIPTPEYRIAKALEKLSELSECLRDQNGGCSFDVTK